MLGQGSAAKIAKSPKHRRGGSLSIKVTGDKEMLAKVRLLAKTMPLQVAAAIYIECQVIMTDSKENYVPVEWGTLRGSGAVMRPVISPANISVDLGYGGAASPYALEQHENLSYNHTTGEAKYLERPMKKASGHLATRVGRRLRL